MTQNTESMMADLRARLKEEHEKPLLLTGDTASYTREIEAAKKRHEREQAKKERFAKTQKERKDRTRRLIQGGGLLEKAGLLDWDTATLLGGLLALKTQDPKQLESFKTVGVNAFKFASSTGDPGQPEVSKILVRFPGGNPGRETLEVMKASGKGWKWDGENGVWTGTALPEGVRHAVAPVTVEIENI